MHTKFGFMLYCFAKNILVISHIELKNNLLIQYTHSKNIKNESPEYG